MPVNLASQPSSMAKLRPQILCVDSDSPGLVLLDAILAPRGYEVIRAEDGRQALEILKRQAVDCILLGAILPGMDGFAVCALIRAEEALRDVPVLMISALKSREDFIRGIEAGADDYLIKPLDHDIMLARIKMLVKRKTDNDRFNQVNTHMNRLSAQAREIADHFNPYRFDFVATLDAMAGALVRETSDVLEKPRSAMIGILSEANQWQWWHYEYAFHELGKVKLDFNLIAGMALPPADKSKIYTLGDDQNVPEVRQLISHFRARNMSVDNGIGYLSRDLCVLTLNYGNDVGQRHRDLIQQMIAQTRLLYTLSSQVKEVEKSFDYTVYALARAAEAHDEETGQHVHRVADYCGIIAERLGLGADFIRTVSVQGVLHDVGKIYTPGHILRKTDPLSADEWVEIKKHTLWGAKIIGASPRLTVAQSIALNHHEKWDGSGYPRGLKGEAIPIEARIAAIADQYDALRTSRAHKKALDHAAVTQILNHGDGRTKPQHFDPQVLKAYREADFLFEEIYERRKG